ncbi:hypothetical protein MRX96_001798 [Rhipicephalus microplus]
MCPDHVFYMAMKVMRHNVSSKTMTFRTYAITSAITRQQLENAHFMDEVLNRDLGFMRGIPNTVQYWQDRRKELFAMIRELDKRCSPFKPYVVVDFFKRVEFQQRGSAHIHTILWLDNAPQEEVSGNMPRTLEMVESLLTLDTDLLKRPRTQLHAHTHTCYRRGRTKCRFGAPFMPSNDTRIVVPFPPTEDEAEKAHRQKLKQRPAIKHWFVKANLRSPFKPGKRNTLLRLTESSSETPSAWLEVAQQSASHAAGDDSISVTWNVEYADNSEPFTACSSSVIKGRRASRRQKPPTLTCTGTLAHYGKA